MLAQPRLRTGPYRVATLQLITFAARGLAAPFINLYLVSVGFTGTNIGILTSASALLQLTAAPFLLNVADRFSKQRRLYYGFLYGNICACLGLVAFGGFPLLLSPMILFRDLTDLPGVTLLAQLTITSLEQRGRQIYGQVRAWGSFGWALATMLSGTIVGAGGYPLLFILSAVVNLSALPIVRVLPLRTNEPRPHTEADRSTARPRGFYILLASIFLYFVGAAAFNAFSLIYFKQGLGASNQMLGLISSLSALSEIPAMMLIDRVLRRVDIRLTLGAGLLGLGSLWLALSLLTGTTLLIPLMLLRGTFYTLQSVSLTLLVSRISHPSNVATNQALAQVTVPGIAILLTGAVSGWLFDHAGGRGLFQLAALMAAASIVLLILARKQLTGGAGMQPRS
jgi:PPP family 3-phenylpropionic acid transporter